MRNTVGHVNGGPVRREHGVPGLIADRDLAVLRKLARVWVELEEEQLAADLRGHYDGRSVRARSELHEGKRAACDYELIDEIAGRRVYNVNCVVEIERGREHPFPVGADANRMWVIHPNRRNLLKFHRRPVDASDACRSRVGSERAPGEQPVARWVEDHHARLLEGSIPHRRHLPRNHVGFVGGVQREVSRELEDRAARRSAVASDEVDVPRRSIGLRCRVMGLGHHAFAEVHHVDIADHLHPLAVHNGHAVGHLVADVQQHFGIGERHLAGVVLRPILNPAAEIGHLVLLQRGNVGVGNPDRTGRDHAIAFSTTDQQAFIRIERNNRGARRITAGEEYTPGVVIQTVGRLGPAYVEHIPIGQKRLHVVAIIKRLDLIEIKGVRIERKGIRRDGIVRIAAQPGEAERECDGSNHADRMHRSIGGKRWNNA